MISSSGYPEAIHFLRAAVRGRHGSEQGLVGAGHPV